ncbi:hypothetical protein OP10G_3405 [Fimbriimonas ginsengisoli Gsoil 348]|uniref:Integral membrane protein n=2 Tax=Fimbriimonas ginsengisoli TaxID=1005039 RepID=A0A068NT94_FIMGI|nr:hypothetical protein OP10G_3405 [Fimbriimonas ginsengisoli Gsoil 348]
MAPSDIVLGVFASIVAATVLYILSGGMMRMAVKQVYGEQISALDVFAGFKNFGSAFGACLLMLLAIYLSAIACLVPALFVSGALAFTPVIVIDQQVGGAEAVKRSFNALKPHAWLMFCLLFVAGIISGLGMCLCGVGVLFTYPIYTAVIGLHYTYFFPRNPQPAGAPMYMVDPVIEDK